MLFRSWQHANILFPSMRRILSVDSEDLAREAGISEKIWRQIKLGEIAEVSSGDFLHKRETEKAKDKSLIGETLIDLENQLDSLLTTANKFDEFVDNYDNNSTISNNTFGDFTINIVTEEVVDPQIKLRRRYGIAQRVNGEILS